MVNITLHPNRGHKIAILLHEAFSSTGIHGHTEMPEDIVPKDIKKGSLEHILFSEAKEYYIKGQIDTTQNTVMLNT